MININYEIDSTGVIRRIFITARLKKKRKGFNCKIKKKEKESGTYFTPCVGQS